MDGALLTLLCDRFPQIAKRDKNLSSFAVSLRSLMSNFFSMNAACFSTPMAGNEEGNERANSTTRYNALSPSI